jgi:hypothetical protein
MVGRFFGIDEDDSSSSRFKIHEERSGDAFPFHLLTSS